MDGWNRETLDSQADTPIPGKRVVRVLEQIAGHHSYPDVIQVDRAPFGWSSKFRGIDLDPGAAWAAAHENRVKLHFFEPGKPTQNARIESFNGKLRDECLSQEYFLGHTHARCVLSDRKTDYNTVRPHSALGLQNAHSMGTRPSQKLHFKMRPTSGARHSDLCSAKTSPRCEGKVWRRVCGEHQLFLIPAALPKREIS